MNKVARAYLFFIGIFAICSLLCLILLLSLLISWKSSQPLHHLPSLVSSIQTNHSSSFISHLSLSTNKCPDDFIPLLSQLKTSPVNSHCKCETSRKPLSGNSCGDCELIPAAPSLFLFKMRGYMVCARPYQY